MFTFEDRTRAILKAVWRIGSFSAAGRILGMDAANTRRHVRTAEERTGARLVVASRGGRGTRNARLTPAGRRLLGATTLVGVVGIHDPAEGVTPVRVGRRVIFVAGRFPEGPAELSIPPASIILERPARGPRAQRSPRNEIPMRVESVRDEAEGILRVRLAAGALKLDALIVRGAQRELKLRPGVKVLAVVKAVAIDVAPLATGESLRPHPTSMTPLSIALWNSQ